MEASPAILYAYPTTWVFVDDQERFLNAVELMVPQTQPYSMWTSPRACLSHLGAMENIRSSTRPVEGEPSRREDEDVLVRFELDKITAQLIDRKRFCEVGVVVTDFAMPGLSGLEFVSLISDASVKKVLLTGAADEKLAVKAFNDGLIDRFVLKSDPDAIAKVLEFCQELEVSRFEELQRHLMRYLPPSFIAIVENVAFQQLFSRQREKYAIVEYYFSASPLGFYCLDREGRAYFLGLFDEASVRESKAYSHQKSIPENLAVRLRQSAVQVGLFESFADDAGSAYDWEFNSIAIEEIPRSEGLYWGIHTHPPMDVDFEPTRCSLDAYLLES